MDGNQGFDAGDRVFIVDGDLFRPEIHVRVLDARDGGEHLLKTADEARPVTRNSVLAFGI